jgi:hypothetical protein
MIKHKVLPGGRGMKRPRPNFGCSAIEEEEEEEEEDTHVLWLVESCHAYPEDKVWGM